MPSLFHLLATAALTTLYGAMITSALATIWVWAVWRTLDTLARHLDGFAPFIVALFAMLPAALWLALSMSASPAASLS